MEEKMNYFIEQTNKQFDEVKEMIKEINTKTDQLIGFRWMLIGGAVGVSTIVSVLFNVIRK